VRDTGTGIDPAHLPRQFEPFSPADDGLSRRHAGNGVGLNLARRVLEIHGARLEVESVPGQGSEFTVQFALENDC
jgi:protein-histidine pros-kinase